MRAIFLTHAEVEIDPEVPVPDWGLSTQGRARHADFADDPCLDGVTAIFASAERKAREGAAPVADRLGVEARVRPALGENDRSATGYLPRAEFERTADAFFAAPDRSIRGWERARDAQARIVRAVRSALAEERPDGEVLFVAHGGVGALLRSYLLGREVTRDEDQTPGGGCWFAFADDLSEPPTPWRRIP